MVKERHSSLTWRRRLGGDVAALVLLLFLCVLFHWPILTPADKDRGSFRSGDFYVQTYACSVYRSRQVWTDGFPLWNPHVYSGHPYLADLQNSALYPPALLTLLVSRPWGYPVLALEIEAIAHMFLAASGTYFLAKRLNRCRVVALIVAIVFTFGGYLTSFPPLQLPILETVAWLPFALLLLDLASAARSHQRLVLLSAWAGAVLAVAILAGHAQTVMYVVYLSCAWYLVRSWGFGHRAMGRLLLGLGVFLVVAGGLAAIQLLPALELMRLSIRAAASYQDLAGGFARKDLLQILMPGMAGYWSPLYIGALPLVWVFYAWLNWSKGRTVPTLFAWRAGVGFWTAMAALALLLSMGEETFLYSLFYLGVPGFGLFRSQERIALIYSLSMALLSGYGLSWFACQVRSPELRQKAFHSLGRVFVGLAGGLFLVAGLLYQGWLQVGGEQGELFHSFLGVALFVGMVLAGGWLWLTGWHRLHWPVSPALGLLACLIVFDLFTLNAGTNVQNRLPQRQVLRSPVIAAIQEDSGLLTEPVRVYHGGWHLLGNYGCLFDLEDTAGASQMQLAAYARFLDRVPLERQWDLLNVRYVVTWNEQLPVPSTVVHLSEDRRDGAVYVHRLDKPPKPAWAVFEVEAASEDEALERLAQPDFAWDQVALVAAADAVAIGMPMAPSEATIRSRRVDPDYLVLGVDMPSQGLLVVSELFYPGWRAWIDGQRVPLLRADAILRAIEVPSGQHEVEMRFTPTSVYLGAGLSLLTVVLVLGYTIWADVNRRVLGS